MDNIKKFSTELDDIDALVRRFVVLQEGDLSNSDIRCGLFLLTALCDIEIEIDLFIFLQFVLDIEKVYRKNYFVWIHNRHVHKLMNFL